MKKIIDGKVYDTSTATCIGYWCNTSNPRDFDYVREDLFRKRTGEYFLDGEGGPRTQYAVSEGQNWWSSGEKLIPLTYEAAKQWAEGHLDADEYEKEFGAVAEDDSTESITVSLPASAAEKLRRAAREKGVGLSAYVASLAEQTERADQK